MRKLKTIYWIIACITIYLLIFSNNVLANNVPSAPSRAQYPETAGKDFIVDAPWRVASVNTDIPVLVYIKDADKIGGTFTLEHIRGYRVVYNAEGKMDEEETEKDKNLVLKYNPEPDERSIGSHVWTHFFNGSDLVKGQHGGPLTATDFGVKGGEVIDLWIVIARDLGLDVKQRIRVYVAEEALPTFDNWYYGDPHYHSEFTQNPKDFGGLLEMTQKCIEAIGLDWVTATDHSTDYNQTSWDNSQPTFDKYENYPIIIRAEELTPNLPLYLGIGLHTLYYGSDVFIYRGTTGGANPFLTKALLVLLSEVENSGGFSYAAHPESEHFYWSDEHYDAALTLTFDTFKGLEIWNTRATVETGKDRNPFDDWEVHDNWDESELIQKDLKNGIKRWDRYLSRYIPRKIFLSGGSDAHGDFNYGRNDLFVTPTEATDNAFGKVRTVVYCPDGLSKNSVLEALKNGQSVVTDGPLVIFGLDRNRDGDIADVGIDVNIGGDTVINRKEAEDANLYFQWKTTPDFGELYSLKVLRGSPSKEQPDEIYEIPAGELAFSGSKNIPFNFDRVLPNQDGWYYYRVETVTKPIIDPRIKIYSDITEKLMGHLTRYRCYTNPIWIKVTSPTQPYITAYNLNPTTANPEDTLTISYTINNPTSEAIDVGLGCSIQKEGTTNWISDPNNDKVVNVAPGTGDYSREFALPAGLSSGNYKVAWKLWNSDFSIVYDSEQSSNALIIEGLVPSDILSPVAGEMEVVSSLEQCTDTKWCFNQHKSGGHVPGGGICQGDDTYAWDVNLNTPEHDTDEGKPVYAVEQGEVSQSFGDCTNAGGSYGQLLIEHKYQGNSWWSGYLHLKDIQVSTGQNVDKNTLLGYISNTSPESIPNHLHFVVYKGQNSRGKLISFDANIITREFSPRFNPGDYIQTTADLHIRTDPEIDDNIITTIPSGRTGQVVDDENNGIFADGYYWWHVQFGADNGWCAENWLEKYTLPLANWTVIVYLGADNNLESFAIDDINEMETVGSNDDVKVIALFDRPGENTAVYEITQDSTDSIASEVKKDYGDNKNSGSPETLKDFISWTTQNYPAQHYNLVMWNHSTASHPTNSIVYDDTSGDHLTITELKNALSDAGAHFDVLGFDAGMMGTVEASYQLKDYGDYIVSSEEEVPEDGLPYDTILTDLVSNPTMSGEAMAETVVTQYGNYYQPQTLPTMAAVDTSSLSNLTTAVDTFSQKLIDSLSTSRADIETVRDDVEWYTSDSDPDVAHLHNIFIDLYHFAELVKQNISDADVVDSADSVMDNLNNSVIFNWYGGDHPNSHGMTVYFTKQDDPDRTYDSSYETLDFSARTQWNEFLKMYLAEMSIVSPTQSNPANAGLKDSPRKIDVELQVGVTPQITIHGLNKDDFNVQIGGKSAIILNATELADAYLLEVLPPQQDTYARYDLRVSMNWLSGTEVEAVIYSEGTNVDTVLVLDRSGSMDSSDPGVSLTYMELAKNGAKQFVEFMNEGDQIGVVSFSSYATVNYPLTLIIPTSPGTIVFSDDMESGVGNWTADSPWTQITTDSHSPTTCWTDSPLGDYSDNADTSLTSTAISIPTDGNAFLSFWHHYRIESGYDYGKVEISTDGGSTWSYLASYSGSQYDWIQAVVDLTSYVGETIKIRFRLDADSLYSYDGWYIDDVEIKTGVSDVKQWAKNAIGSIYAGGSTSIGDGLQDSREQLVLYGDPDHDWATILLSDGYENESPWVSDVLPTIPERIDVYTIALGADSDEALLQNIATETGGQYYFSPTAQELQGIYNLIRGGVVGEETIASKSNSVNQGETKTETVQIDSTVKEATFGTSWSGSDLDLTLTDPNGATIDSDVAETDPNIDFVSSSTYENYLVTSPTPGEWSLNIQGVDTPSGGEGYTATVTAQTTLTLRAYFDKSDYETAQPITILVALSDPSGPIRGANIEVDVQAPQQSLSVWKGDGGKKGDKVPTIPLRKPISVLKSLSSSGDVFQLYDDGTHGDGQANDGIYGHIYADTSNSGSYIFNFDAEGSTNDGYAFTRTTQRSVFVAEPQATGSISGTVSYSGAKQGTIQIQSWKDDPTMHGNPDYLTSISSPDSYTLSNLPDGSFYLSYYMDVNGNDNQDIGEPSGIYGAPGTPTSVAISGGSSVSGIDVTLLSSPSSLIGFSDDGSITVAWSPSSTPDVAGYKIYYGTTSGSYSNVIDAAGGIYHEITGLDNSLTYFITLTSYGNPGSESAYSDEITASPGVEAVELHAGWNIIALPRLPLSVYLAGGATDNLSSVLSSVQGKFNSVWAHDASTDEWSNYTASGLSILNSLTGLVSNRGYWIDMKEDATLEVSGAALEEADLDLKSGWNLTGYSLKEAQSINSLSSWFAGGELASIWTYSASGEWLRYDATGPEFLNDLTDIEPGRGYMMYALEDFTMHLEVPPSSAPASAPQLPPVIKGIEIPPVQLPPSTIYGTVERNGEILTKRDNCVVSLRVEGETLASYKLGSEEEYENLYLLQLPNYLRTEDVKDGKRVELFVNEKKVSEIEIAKPGEIKRFDVSFVDIPEKSALLQNFPNPFNPDTWIPYQLRKDADVKIEIYNLAGELVRAVDLGYRTAGYYTSKTKSAYWDGRNEVGERVSSGVYFYRIRAGEFNAIKKMIVLK